MGFTNVFFWFAFIFYFIIYWVYLNKPERRNLRNFSLLIVSYIFYATWDWRFLGIILFSSILDYTVGLKLESTINNSTLCFVLSFLLPSCMYLSSVTQSNIASFLKIQKATKSLNKLDANML